VAVNQFGNTLVRISGVGVGDADQRKARISDAGLERRPITAIPLMADNPDRIGQAGDDCRRAVFRTIVNDDDFVHQTAFRHHVFKAFEDGPDTAFLVIGGNYNTDAIGLVFWHPSRILVVSLRRGKIRKGLSSVTRPARAKPATPARFRFHP
jgi:hypothetical protein